MWKKIKPYLRFWKKKPSYYVEGSIYGGLRMDIDEYYSIEENRTELDEINESFGKLFKNEKDQKEEETTSIT